MYKHLTWDDRLKIEALLRVKTRISEIAKVIGCHRSTIYREIKRGKYIHTMDYYDEERYSPELAQADCDFKVSMRGRPQLKIENDYEYAEYIEQKILEEKYSPAAVLGELERTGEYKRFKTKICVRTLYNYINDGVFLHLTNKDLPVKAHKKKRHYYRIRKRAAKGDSIEKRSDSINTRQEFGHWEMDTVVGKQKTKECLLVLTERKTRKEIIKLLKEHTTKCVVEALNELEKSIADFRKIFKTVTCDNGSEFMDFEGMKKSCIYDTDRFQVYYCHSYSSWERGSNENCNKLIRRFYKKKTSFKKCTQKDIMILEKWINNYPRKIFGYDTAENRYIEELKKIC